MFRAIARQLSSVLAEIHKPLVAANTLPIWRSRLPSAAVPGKRYYDADRNSVRQKGEHDSQTSSSQNITDGGPTAYSTKKSSPFSFPTLATHKQSFADGIPFEQLPVIHIKATSNNTIVSLTDGSGVVLAIQSGGTVGFRNARKGTNVAAQAAAMALARDALAKDVRAARVCLKGIGPGRLPALKAVQVTGIDVISITDTTPLPHNGNRPKKVRRL